MATIQGIMNPSSNNIIRKVQSMDCVLPSVQIKSEWVFPTNNHSLTNNQKKKASRFSRISNRNLEPPSCVRNRSDCHTAISCTAHHLLESSTLTNNNHNNRGSTIHISSNTSHPTGLNVVAEQQQQQQLFYHGDHHQQQRYNLPYGTLVIVSFFILASLSSYTNESQSSFKSLFVNSVSSQNTHKADGTKNNNNRLGSAMIESVTDVLNPILPFTGGLDLRRDGNWRSWRNWFGLAPSSGENGSQTISLFPRGGARDTTTTTSNTSNNQDTMASKDNTLEQPSYEITLSTTDSFHPTDQISQMTLNEIAFVFRYVIESNRKNFNAKQFFDQRVDDAPLRQRVIDTMRAIDDAAAKSRGRGVSPADTSDIQFDLTTTTTDTTDHHPAPLSPTIGYGDVDALQFCAAMRLFAEWRILRQIPPGYKAYAVGMNLGHKDIVQNVAKIEKAAHEWIQIQISSAANDYDNRECTANTTSCTAAETVHRSPTLRQLLAHEISTDTHTNHKLPRLKDSTAAMGLLWVRRQLHYQTVIFRNVISVPEVYPSAIKAVGAAYSEVYDGVHGWAVQKIFNYSFQAAPDAKEIFLHMNPDELARIRIAAAAVVVEEDVVFDENDVVGDDDAIVVQNDLGSDDELDDSHDPLLNENVTSQGKEDVNSSTNKDNNPLLKLGSHIASEWDKFGSHITSEWDKLGQHIEGEFEKFTCGIGKMFNHKNSKEEDCDEEKQPVKADSKTRQGLQQQQQQQNNQPALTGELLDTFINERMTLDARRQIATYLLVAQPLLADLAGLFAEMNMDDPTKV